MIQPTRLVIGLGLLASSLTLTTAAHADIPITGGQVTGDAAFFTPTNVPTSPAQPLLRNGTPVLFDTAIQTLRIDTPNGSTTTSRFLPSAARFTDVNANSRPDSGDTGRLEGALSGVAFNRLGSPVFFQNIPTALNFTLTAFNPVFTDPGSLINPQQAGTAPLLFLPGVNVRLSDTSSSAFTSRFGILETGPFAANLTGDFIGLPSDLQLRPATGEVILVPLLLERRVKFDFRGNNARVTDASFGADPRTGRNELNFEGTVNDFQVQSVGTPGTREFKITGSGTLDITLTGPFEIRRDSLNLNTVAPGQTVDYRIQGEGPGFFGVTGANSFAFTGTARRDTQFRFEQNDRRFEGRSGGNVSFVVNDTRDNIDFRNPTFRFTVPVVGVETITTTGTPFVSSPPLPAGGSTTTTTTTTSAVFTTTVFNTTSINIFPGYRSFLIERSREDDDDDDNQGYSRNFVYYIYTPRGGATEVVIERQGDRILVVDRTAVRGRKLKKRGQVVAAYQVIGLPSRVFPGLTGLRQLPPEQVPAASLDDPELDTATVEEMAPAAIAPVTTPTAIPVATTTAVPTMTK